MSRLSFILLAAVVVGCQQSPNSLEILRSDQDYVAANTRVQELTKGPFEAMHEGHPISDREKEGLKEAERLIESMIGYRADAYPTYILKGLTKRALGDNQAALEAYQQGLKLKPAEPTANDKAVIGRIYDELATLYFEMGKFADAEQNANEAIKYIPDDPSILTNAASIKIQVKKTSEASQLIDRALKIAPDYQRARDLKKLLGMAPKNGKK